MSNYWHPFSDVNAIDTRGEFVLERGEGSWVWDTAGKKYFDASAALWYVNVGHGRQAIGDAMAAQAGKIASYSNFGDAATPSTLELADLVTSLAPVPDSKIFFTSGGSDSVDTAIKMVRRFWTLKGQPNKKTIITRHRGYHGMHTGGTSIAGIPDNNVGYGDLIREVANVPWDDADELIAHIDRIGEDNIAALFAEPVIGAGGALFAPDMYLETIRKACAERNILFVADEVITGFGRTGYWFASERFNLNPDLILCAKGITSGYAPLGGVIASPSVWKTFAEPDAGIWRHGYTYSGHATACAAGLANLKIMIDEDLPGNVRRNEEYFAAKVKEIQSPLVDHVRSGVGYLAGIQLVDPTRAMEMYLHCRSQGVLSRPLIGGALQISPALSTTREEIDQVVDLFNNALN